MINSTWKLNQNILIKLLKRRSKAKKRMQHFMTLIFINWIMRSVFVCVYRLHYVYTCQLYFVSDLKTISLCLTFTQLQFHWNYIPCSAKRLLTLKRKHLYDRFNETKCRTLCGFLCGHRSKNGHLLLKSFKFS